MTNQEPRYKREVFEGLLHSLDVVLTDDNSIIHMPDDVVRRNYDIRDDGVWLQQNGAVSVFNWTPACDLEEGPDSPDPLTTPALPFPFTARQLAAFTLGGWGWFLGERFADNTGLLDAEVVQLLLSGSRNTKLRESITAAFSALENARLNAPIPDPELERALVKAQEECEAAETAAGAAHDWRDTNQPEAVREKRRLAYLAAVNPHRQKKREAQVATDEAQETWRKAMVRQLLNPTPPKQEPSDIERQELGDALMLLDAQHNPVAQPAPTLSQAETPTPVVGDSAIKAPHMTRRDLLTPAIEAAQKECDDPFDAPAVWDVMSKMAQIQKHRLLGASEDGIKWMDANDEPQFFKLKDLRDRLRRKKKKAL